MDDIEVINEGYVEWFEAFSAVTRSIAWHKKKKLEAGVKNG